MRVSEIRITNFRCVAEATYRLDDSTALVGSNGAGKSTLIRALLLFYDGIARPSEGDHFNGDTTHPIEIQVSFTQLSENEREELRDLIDADGNLKITLRARIADGGRPDVGYYVHRRRYPAFETVRAAASAAERQEAAKALQQTDLSMYDFEIGRSWSLTDESLRAWEERNPELCEVVLTQVSLDPPNQPESRLYPFTQLVFVPAVRDAADEAVEGRGNLMSRLIDMAVGDISATPEFQDANRDFKNRYQSLVQTTSERLLPRLQDRIETALRQYAPGVCVRLQWSGADVRLIAPQAIAYLDDGGFLGDVPSKGHGLQRLFIVALLQAASELLRRSSDSGNAEATRSDLHHYILAIEEPELYQHPIQARKFARVLSEIAAGGSSNTQVLVSTHSPFFVPVDVFDALVLVRKPRDSGHPPRSQLSTTNLESVMAAVAAAFERTGPTEDRFRAGLSSVLTTSVMEGFFASIVVLVEGEEDKALLEAGLRTENVDIEGLGISVIPVNGKNNIDRCLSIFRSLDIPCFTIFDGDAHKAERQRQDVNVALQRLCNVDDPQPSPETFVNSNIAVFRETFARQIETECPRFVEKRNEVAERLGWAEPSAAAKNATVVRSALKELLDEGQQSQTLRSIVSAIRSLAGDENEST